jgi:hypothetical protein
MPPANIYYTIQSQVCLIYFNSIQNQPDLSPKTQFSADKKIIIGTLHPPKITLLQLPIWIDCKAKIKRPEL